MKENEVVLNREGRPFGTETELKILKELVRKGPYSHRTEKFKAIAKLFDSNQQNRIKKRKEVSIEAFCDWTKIPERMVRDAETDPDFVRVVQALSKGKTTSWFNAMLPTYMEAAERLSKNPEEKPEVDKQFMNIMQTIATMTNFEKSDLNALSAMDDKDPQEIIEEAIAIGIKLTGADGNKPLSAQKIIELLSEGVDRATSLRHNENNGSALSVNGRTEEDSTDKPDFPVDTVPEAKDRALLAERDYLLHGSERNGQIGLPDSIHSLVSLGEASGNKAEEETGGMAST